MRSATAGHDPEVRYAFGWRVLPDIPFNLTPGRRRVKRLTGSTDVPVLELDDGTAIGGTQGDRRLGRGEPRVRRPRIGLPLRVGAV